MPANTKLLAPTEEENESTDPTKQILSFLKNGEAKIKIRHLPYNEVVLVLGLTGSGKSTFTQFVTGNTHLEARENGKDTGEFSVIDTSPNPRVCSSTIDSCTTLPDLILDPVTKTAFYDCPGFSDTRSAVHDISVTYFISKVLDSADAVKMVFTVNYPSVQRGMDRQNFMLLMRNALNLIKDVNHFASSIALVVTKVDNRVVFRKGLPALVSDEAIIEGIASFLEEIQQNLINKIAQKVDPDDEQFFTRAVQLIDVLLKKDGANYTRIALFRRPNEPGVLSELDLLQKNKKNLEKMIHQNLHFAQSSSEYYGHTISAESKNRLHGIVEEMNLNIASAVADISDKIIQKAKDHERSSKDIDDIFKRSRLGYNLLHKLKTTSNFQGPRDLMESLVRALNELNVKVATKDIIVDMIHYDRFISFINEIENGLAKAKPDEWTAGLSQVVSYYSDAQAWYNFLINLSVSLSSYPVQQSIVSVPTFELKNQIKAYTVDDQPVFRSLKQFLTQVVKGDAEKEFDNISNAKLDWFKLRFLNSMLDVDIHESCTSPNKLEITGQFIKLSDVAEVEKKLRCKPIKTLEIFALKKVFIDTDFFKTGQKIQLVIVAPTWEVIGSPKIVLDGEEGHPHIPSKAPSAVGHGQDGVHGLPGLPGGAAGNFIGIGNHCTYCDRLLITANGGKGGPGQSGGDGADGEAGRPGRVPRDQKTTLNLLIFKVHHDDNGYEGGFGGNGGNAGAGGIGGQPGEIKLMFDRKSSKPLWTAEDGQNGEGGEGGAGGLGGLGKVNIESKTDIFGVTAWSNGIVYLEERRASSGYEGYGIHSKGFFSLGNFNYNGQMNPEDKTALHNPSYSVNAYKASLREHFSKNALSPSMAKLFSHLENDETVRALYDTSGLTDDLKRLENQFYALNKKISFAPFYKSLLERIQQYAEHPKEGEHSEQYRKVLAYLHLSTLSKICSLENANNELVINMKDYFGQVFHDIDDLNDLIMSMEKNKKKTTYQRVIELKVKSASEFIKNEISTDIRKNIEEVDEQIGLLINEISARKNKLLEAEKRKLEDLLLKRTWLRILDVGRLVLDFFGMGLAGEAVIAGTKSMVKEELELDENQELEADNVPRETPDALNTFITSITDGFKKKVQTIVFQLLGVEEKLGELPEEDLPEEVRDLKKNVEETRKELGAKIESNDTVDSDFIDKVYSKKYKIEELLQKQVDALEGTGIPEDGLKQILKQTLSIMSRSDLLDIPNNSGEGSGKIDRQFATLEVYEKKIYEIIVPLCHKVGQMASSLVKKGRSQSQLALDMRKLGIQKTLLDIQDQIQRMTEGFEAQGQLLRSVEKLNFGMSTMIQLFDRIQEYLDRAELADYIADVNSVKARGIHIDKKELQDTMDELKFMIHTNFVLSEYEKAMGAFGQAMFPYAHLYLAEFNLPPHLQGENTTRNFISTVAAQVTTLESRIQKNDLVIDGLQDAHIYRNIEFSSAEGKPPFFSWDHDTFGGLISELLSGNEITLHADITKGLNENAIKFNEISVNFDLPNSVRAEEFFKELENYNIEMKHMGTSYYRCGGQFYVMTHEPLTIIHSLQKADVPGGFKGQNGVYEKITKNNPLLSPYTMWKIKLSKSSGDFSSLSEFKDEMINLELEGIGQYVSHSIDDVVCNEDLQKYYTLDRSVNELNHVELFGDPRILSKNVVLDYRTEVRKRRSVEERRTASISEDTSLWSSTLNTIRSITRRIVSPIFSTLPRENHEEVSSAIPTPAIAETPQEPQFLKIAAESGNGGPMTDAVDYGLVSTHGNLLLLDLLMRKRVGSKMSQKTFPEETTVSKQAHNLAYSAHVPYNEEEEEEEGDNEEDYELSA